MGGTWRTCWAAWVALLVLCWGLLGAAGTDNRTITDQAGREVRLPARVERVVCLWPESACVLYAVGAGDLVIGVDARTPQHPVLRRVWPGLQDLPVVGTLTSANTERLLVQRPDLVIVSARSAALAERLSRLGLTVVCLHPRGKWKNYLEEVRLIGQCVGREERADGLRRFLERRMAEVEEVVSAVPHADRPRVYVTFAYDPLRTTPLDSVELAGGVNLAQGNRDIWYTVDMEWLLGRDPDVIVQHAMGTYDLTRMGGGWRSLRAVKERRVYRVFLGYCGVDPALYVQQVRQMAALFHGPQAAWARDLRADGRAIFERVYGRGEVFDDLARELNLTLALPPGPGGETGKP